MPVLYQPPEPFAPSISASYGQAEQFDRIAPLLAQQQIANQHAQLQAAAIGQQGAIAAGHQMMQEEQFRQGLYQHGYDAAAGRNLAAAEADARIRAAPELARQHAELSAWLSNQEMTQAENMRMQRMQGAVGEVIQGMKEGRFSQEDGENMLMQLKTGIDGYRQRQEKALARQEEMKANLFDQQAAKIKLHDKVAAEMAAKDLPARTHHVTMPDGTVESFIANPDGTFTQIKKSAPEGGKDRAFEYKQEQDVRKEWHDAHKRAREQVDAWSKEKYKDKNGKEHYRYENLAQSDEARQAWTNILMAESGMDPNLETHVRKRLGKPMPGSGGEGQPGGQPGGGSQSPGGGAPAPKAADRAVEALTAKAASAPPLIGGEFNSQLAEYRRIVGKHGTVAAALKSDDGAKLREVLERLDRLDALSSSFAPSGGLGNGGLGFGAPPPGAAPAPLGPPMSGPPTTAGRPNAPLTATTDF